jgi:hypothetical protein
MSFNKFVLSNISANVLGNNERVVHELKQIAPQMSDLVLLQLYIKSVSLHQSKNSHNGKFLENTVISSALDNANIPYRKQVTIDKSGLIVGFNETKKNCYHIVDFVIGNEICIGKTITEFGVVSCKTTCRERWTQDDWSFTYQPKLYLLTTLTNDYPSNARFRESDKRKIITCIPKQNDDRVYPLNYDNLLSELQIFSQV